MGKIDFIPYDKIKKNTERIDFVPNEAYQRVLRNEHSDINELKSYLKPPKKKGDN